MVRLKVFHYTEPLNSKYTDNHQTFIDFTDLSSVQRTVKAVRMKCKNVKSYIKVLINLLKSKYDISLFQRKV